MGCCRRLPVLPQQLETVGLGSPTWKPKQMVGMTLKTEAQEEALRCGGRKHRAKGVRPPEAERTLKAVKP